MRGLFLLLGIVLFISFAPLAGAQSAPGTPNFSAYDCHEVDCINLSNLNIVIRIPIFSKAGAFPISYSMVGTSGIWYNPSSGLGPGGTGSWQPNFEYGPGQFGGSVNGGELGWGNFFGGSQPPYATYTQTIAELCPNGTTHTTWYSGWVVIDANYTVHSLPIADHTDTANCYGSGFTDTASDGSGYSVSATSGAVTGLYDANGSTLTETSITDSNGNKISVSNSGTGTGQTLSYTDTLGLTALQIAIGTNDAPSWTDFNGGSPAVTPTWTRTTIRTNFLCSAKNEFNDDATLTLLTNLAYPDGTFLAFSYEPGYSGDYTGRLAGITLREGGSISYAYSGGNSGINCTYQIPPTLKRTTSDGMTEYDSSPSSSGNVTTVTDAGGNKTVYTFTGSVSGTLVLTQVQRYLGSTLSPTTLLTTDVYCYNAQSGQPGNCAAAPVTMPISEKDIYHTIYGMSTSSRSQIQFDKYGNATYSARYDFGATNPTVTTTTTYGTWNGTNCVSIGSNINDKPCDVLTQQSGSNIAESRFAYDSHGNLLTLYKWTGSAWLSNPTANVYNSNGTPKTIYDAANNPTNYSYLSNNYTCSGCIKYPIQYPFPTSVTKGGLTIHSAWNATGGVKLSDTDASGNATAYCYAAGSACSGAADPYWRVLSVHDPYGSIAYKTYPTGSSPDTIGASFTFGSSIEGSTITADSYGRPTNSQRAQSPSGSDYDTVSAAHGWSTNYRTVATSQPCSATLGSGCTTVHTKYFDPLGRLQQSTTVGNETLTHTYSQNDDLAVLTPPPSGENSKQVQHEYDGLGRLTKSCAIGNGSTTACGQNYGSQNGVTTSNSYTAATGSTTVSSTRGAQTRSKTFDALGRVTSSTTPEGGTTTYGYDAAVCGWPAEPGQLTSIILSNGGIICVTHNDSLGRLTDEGLGGVGTAYCKRFRYDGAANGVQVQPSGSTISNAAGRMVEAETDTCGVVNGRYVVITDEWFSYDADGRMTDMWEFTPHSTQYYHSTATFAANGGITTLQLASPSLYTINYGLDGEGRPNTLSQGSTSIVTATTYNAADQATNVTLTGSGPDQDTYTYDPNTGQMTQFEFQVGSANETGVLTWNPSRTLQKLAITDGFNTGGSQTCYFNPTSAPGTGYDDLNRLVGMDCGSGNWGQTFSYDQYDNLTQAAMSGHTGGTWNPGYNGTASNNHVNGATYDASGNMTNDGGSNVYSWNADGKIAWTASSGTPTCGSSGKCTTYDAFGRMVEVSFGSAWAEFWYTQVPGSRITMSGITSSSAYWPSPGRGVFVASSTNTFLHPDWLGNDRIVSTTAGHVVAADRAYAPYGEQYNSFGSANPIYGMFASMTGDFDSGVLFDTPNREFAQSQGRWISPDPAGFGWNQYAHTTNPNSFIDPTGLGQGGTAGCATYDDCAPPGCGFWCFMGSGGDNDLGGIYQGATGSGPSNFSGFSGFSGGSTGGAGASSSWGTDPNITNITAYSDDGGFGGSVTVSATADQVDPLTAAEVAAGTAGAGMTGEGLLQQGLTAGYGKSVFYTGYRDGALTVAETLGTPISSTPVGQVYSSVAPYLPDRVALGGWDYLSGLYAGQAEGPINVVIGESGTGASLLWQTEFPILVDSTIEGVVTDWTWTLVAAGAVIP